MTALVWVLHLRSGAAEYACDEHRNEARAELNRNDEVISEGIVEGQYCMWGC